MVTGGRPYVLPKLWVNEGREQDGVKLVKGNGRVISMYGCGLTE